MIEIHFNHFREPLNSDYQTILVCRECGMLFLAKGHGTSGCGNGQYDKNGDYMCKHCKK